MNTPNDDARNAKQTSNGSRRWRWLAGTFGGLLTVALVYGLYWAQVLRYHQSTDDAYVGGNVVQITPQRSSPARCAMYATSSPPPRSSRPPYSSAKPS